MPAILGWLVEICGTLVGHVLIALGISYFSYKGLDLMLVAAKTQFFGTVGGLGSTVVGLMGLCKLDVCVNMLVSAVLARLTLAGLTSGALKKMVLK